MIHDKTTFQTKIINLHLVLMSDAHRFPQPKIWVGWVWLPGPRRHASRGKTPPARRVSDPLATAERLGKADITNKDFGLIDLYWFTGFSQQKWRLICPGMVLWGMKLGSFVFKATYWTQHWEIIVVQYIHSTKTTLRLCMLIVPVIPIAARASI